MDIRKWFKAKKTPSKEEALPNNDGLGIFEKQFRETRLKLHLKIDEQRALEHQKLYEQIEANDGEKFINTEPTCILHDNPNIHLLLLKMSSTRSNIRYSEWRISRLKKQEALSDYDKVELEQLPLRIKLLIKQYEQQEKELAELQNKAVNN